MHETRVELTPTPVSEAEAGAEILFQARVSCPSGCELVGRPVRVLPAEGTPVQESHLKVFEEGVNRTETIRLRAPSSVGAYEWSVVFPGESDGPIGHKQTSRTFTTVVKAHTTSIAVWDLSSPVQIGRTVRFKVGVKCSFGCCLRAQRVEVVDAAGLLVGTAALGSTPWPGTDALYWAEGELAAAETEGTHARTIQFPASQPDLPHEPAAHRFHFMAVRPPDCALTVRVVEKGTETPLGAAEVRLGAYRGRTDEAGVARLALPNGQYPLHIWKEGYALSKALLDVCKDSTVSIEIEAAPEPEEEYWM